MPHAHRFLGNSVLWWDLKNDVTISTPWYLGLVFRTRAREGTLLQAQAGQYTSLLFQVCAHTHTHTRWLSSICVTVCTRKYLNNWISRENSTGCWFCFITWDHGLRNYPLSSRSGLNGVRENKTTFHMNLFIPVVKDVVGLSLPRLAFGLMFFFFCWRQYFFFLLPLPEAWKALAGFMLQHKWHLHFFNFSP